MSTSQRGNGFMLSPFSRVIERVTVNSLVSSGNFLLTFWNTAQIIVYSYFIPIAAVINYSDCIWIHMWNYIYIFPYTYPVPTASSELIIENTPTQQQSAHHQWWSAGGNTTRCRSSSARRLLQYSRQEKGGQNHHRWTALIGMELMLLMWSGTWMICIGNRSWCSRWIH